MNAQKIDGLVAATYTPLGDDGTINTAAVAPITNHLIQSGVSGLYVCGSTGEGMSLSSDERKTIAAAYVRAAAGRVPVIVQVGHNSLADARSLAEHAQQIGADMISATCPSYFKVGTVAGMIDCMSEVAQGAPDLPFYYYHIPALTGSALDVVDFLKIAGDRIANLVGLKYTDTKLHEFQECLELDNGRFDVVWGCDEMLLGALATGARGAIGSTYNIAAPLYQRLITAFREGHLTEARQWQSMSVNMIRTLNHFPFHPAMKAVLGMQGFDMGGCRLPQESLSGEDISRLQAELEAIGFFEWSQTESEAVSTE
ncbi:dihydrodipicolinate synthase family protein [Allorhodopirellula solitaria]|uniref:N-acetylneuraminate lyase n=1 Tax=Allorhodopirellula solitaria TaxID=2527987 RepID=A0A5C5XRI8_9BACT|nr:dihydrodipicolinate synthase family protein [Allorhodopirellula solitaria]TWT65268.1 N-acetylneuraminate lyase [Allorhodopirellula solitaria]